MNVTGTTDEAAMQQILTTNAFPIIMGAIRERIAHLTGRAPWGRFLINLIPLSPATTISYI